MAITGTVVGTLTPINVYGEGATLIGDTLISSFTMSGEPNDPEVVVTSFTLEDTWISIIPQSVTNPFEMSGDPDTPFSITLPQTSSFYMGSSFGSISQTTLMTGTIFLTEEIITSRTLPQTSTFEMSDEITFDRTSNLESAFTLEEEVTPQNSANSLLESSMEFGDELTPGQSALLTSTFEMESTITFDVASTQSLESAIELTEALVYNTTANEALSSTFTLEDSPSFEGSVYAGLLSSAMVFTDAMFAPNFDAIAWILNTESGGLSSYTNFAYNSITSADGVVYATSSEGLYAIDGDTDAGRAIATEIQTGMLDFGHNRKTRVSDLYISYTGGRLECDVEILDNVYTYEIEDRDADSPRSSRFKFGKGLNGHFWRFTLRNVNGSDFQIDTLDAEVGFSNRRM